jgi:hexosaminidase
MALKGDLYLSLRSPDTALGREGYQLAVSDLVKVTARNVTGAFYGTRTVLQLLRRTRNIPAGTARDWPRSGQRGIWVDTTSRFFDLPWWRNLMRDMSYIKLNEVGLQMYGPRVLTDLEVAELTAFAARYHINITPQRQVAGHADLDLLKQYPDYRLDPTASGPPKNAFDFTKPGALDIARRAIEETVAKFPGKYFHAGGDEYIAWQDPLPWSRYPQFAEFARARTGNPNATGGDAFDWYFNWINGIVKAHGKTLAMWNDSLQPDGVVRLDRDIVVDFWLQPCCNNVLTPSALADPTGINGGHSLVNSHVDYLYYDMGVRTPDPQRIYESFTVTRFDGSPGDHEVTGAAATNVLGARLALWTYETPGKPVESNDEMAAKLYGPLRALAQMTWDSPKIHATYGPPGQGYSSLMATLGRAPGYVLTSTTHNSGPGPGVSLEMNGEQSIVRTVGGVVRHGFQTKPGGGPWAFETFPADVLTSIAGDPVLARQRDGTKTLVARRTDGTLVQATQYVGNSGPWEYRPLGVTATGRPKVLVDSRGQLTLAALRSDGTLLFGRESTPRGSWRFMTVGTGLAGNPATALDSLGRIVIVARNSGGTLTLLRQTTPTEDSFGANTIGQVGVVGTPALGTDRSGSLVYFARTNNGSLQHGRQSGAASTWAYQTPASGLAGDPALELDLNGRLVWFARRSDGHLQHGWESSPGSNSFTVEALGGGITGDVSAANDISGRVTYFAMDTTGRIRHGYQTTPGNGPWGMCHLELDC